MAWALPFYPPLASRRCVHPCIQVAALSGSIGKARVMVCQLEVRPDTTLASLKLGKSLGLTTIFNPAPAPSSLDAEFYAYSDIFCVNETEAETLSGACAAVREFARSRAAMSQVYPR